MGTPEQDLRQYESYCEREDELDSIRSARVCEMMDELIETGECFSFDSGFDFSDVMNAIYDDLPELLHALMNRTSFENGIALVDKITEASVRLCWQCARNDITHESLKEAQEFSRAEDRAI